MPVTVIITDPTGLIGAPPPNGVQVRRVNFREALHVIARTAGMEPERNFPEGEANAMVDTINTRTRYAWDYYQWPEFQATEERAFRQKYNVGLTYLAGEEMYYISDGKYYRSLEEIPVDEPPDVSPDKWEEIEILDRYLGYDQFTYQSVGEFVCVNDLNPRLYRPAQLDYDTMPSGYGLDLTRYAALATVWVTYIPLPPEFTTEMWDSTASYIRGDLVFDDTTGECFRALRDSVGQPVTGASYWLMQQMPYVLSEYITSGDVSFLQKEVDKLLRQGARHFYRGGQNRSERRGFYGPFTPWLVEVPVNQ